MKKTALLCTVLATLTSQAPSRPEWDDPAVLHVNTEKPHATMMVYPSAEAAALTRRRCRASDR